jgi:hypothetical protein
MSIGEKSLVYDVVKPPSTPPESMQKIGTDRIPRLDVSGAFKLNIFAVWQSDL